MLSFRPKGGISDSANDRDVSTPLRSITPLESLRSMTELSLLMSTYNGLSLSFSFGVFFLLFSLLCALFVEVINEIEDAILVLFGVRLVLFISHRTNLSNQIIAIDNYKLVTGLAITLY